MDLVDFAVDIPMLGRANSLNVATAFGIAGYEILSRWKSV
jgi:tRNA G18 (ribose-2'-O)-methylase SpoU